ncbi:MAG TPA: HEAT repeat domain-containing protein [Candidatus Binataceae bacterium]|nr:HEAT repeat domain-containing protein [Candidatus Binataceae bacterium]
MTAREIDKLFNQTLSGDYDDDAPWKAVHALRRIGTREVFATAAKWCESIDPLVRARGANVLAQLGRAADHPSNNFPEESYSVITALLERETEICPLVAAIAALGHLGNPLAVPLIVKFHSHSSAEVRYSVAFSLGCFPDDPLSVATLLHLMEDTDEDVRDWATFGLGSLSSSDSTEIRDAFLRHLNDPMDEAREEALVGLARRKDHRVLPALLSALEQPTTLMFEAAYLMLDMETEPEGWTGADYAAALRERFSL